MASKKTTKSLLSATADLADDFAFDTSMQTSEETTHKKSILSRIFSRPALLALVLSLIIATAISMYFYVQYKQLQSKVSAAQAMTKPQKNAHNVAQQIAKHFDVSPNEPITVADVVDASKLDRSVAFFRKAQNGDIVVIYPQLAKAVLYRPSTNKIIDFSIYTDDTATTSSAALAQSTPSGKAAPSTAPRQAKVLVVNVTNISGLAQRTANKLAAMKSVESAKLQSTSVKKTPQDNLVIPITDAHKLIATEVASAVGGRLGSASDLAEVDTRGFDIVILAVE